MRAALAAEFLGTLLLLAIVVGSGIMGERLADGNDAHRAAGQCRRDRGGLYVLIVLLGPISGAHFNPAVTLAMRLRGETLPRHRPCLHRRAGHRRGARRVAGACDVRHCRCGNRARMSRSGAAQWLSEGVATFGLLLTILLGARFRRRAVPALVASYIFAAYWFTASTSFANPAVTLARSLTQTFRRHPPARCAGFVAAQLAGACAGGAGCAARCPCRLSRSAEVSRAADVTHLPLDRVLRRCTYGPGRAAL